MKEPENETERLKLAQEAVHRYELGQQQRLMKQYEKSLENLLWAFDHSHIVAGWGGVRLSFLLGELASLGQEFAPAVEALIERRDRREKLILEGKASWEIVREWTSLNKKLNDSEREIHVLKQLKKQGKLDENLKELAIEYNLYFDSIEESGNHLEKSVLDKGRSLLLSLGEFESTRLLESTPLAPKSGKSFLHVHRKQVQEKTEELLKTLLTASRRMKALEISDRILRVIQEKELLLSFLRIARELDDLKCEEGLWELGRSLLSDDDIAWVDHELKKQKS